MNDGKMVKLQKRIWRERELEQRDIYLKKRNYDTLLSAVYRSILFFFFFFFPFSGVSSNRRDERDRVNGYLYGYSRCSTSSSGLNLTSSIIICVVVPVMLLIPSPNTSLTSSKVLPEVSTKVKK